MTDLRTQRTQKAIADAFVKLVNQTSFREVTVSMIAQEAMINRQTFYRHYEDKYQLTRALLSDFIADYQAEINRIIPMVKDNNNFSSRLLHLQPIIGNFLLSRIELVKALRGIKFDDFNYETEVTKLYREVIQELFNHGDPLTAFQEKVMTNVLLTVIDYLIDNHELPSKTDIEGMKTIILNVFN